ncbi:agmatinase [Rhizobium leguminosarum bv. trifolii WSM2297]|uniref:Agmatinase n=1 Tax=Rhizobium leguminosarum bv. trifolii WSM2297 TaxID=754762 RepID=J0CVH0_RHILT|nr:agmatinase [Rhizobium leguminosarum]EJC83910.1 agmatinase [Rhizobium leguminosarum bv. trifolii WSM2297]EJC84499.1 agmatinase [Rhizobium leguminosarum bv. trifolii WSM2297]
MSEILSLDELRKRYSNASGDEMFDAEFRKVAELVFGDGDSRQAPYCGVPTLLKAAYRPDAAPNFTDMDIALFGIPMDLGVTNRSGARFGPRAVRNVDRVGPYNHVLRAVPTATARVADVGDVPFKSRFDLTASHQDIERFVHHLIGAGVVPLAVGGDHSVSLPILRAVGRHRPVGMIHIDAHCDTGGSFEGCKFHHGGPFRQAVLDGVLDPRRTIQIGIRGNSEYLWEFSYASGMTVIHAEEVADLGIKGVIAKAREIAGLGPTYVSFDVDSLDPAFAPGTGTPEVGGLTSAQALGILRGLAGLNIVGGDVVEIAPQYDPTSNTAQIAAHVLFELLCLAAEAIKVRASW